MNIGSLTHDLRGVLCMLHALNVFRPVKLVHVLKGTSAEWLSIPFAREMREPLYYQATIRAYSGRQLEVGPYQ